VLLCARSGSDADTASRYRKRRLAISSGLIEARSRMHRAVPKPVLAISRAMMMMMMM
jgi:hypothetical protein